jgi:hypothetical protein
MSENGQRVIAEVRAEAARRPNHVYDSACVYVVATHRGIGAGCLIGVGLWNAGLIGPKFLHDSENTEPISLIGRYMFNLDADEISWLREVQLRQDAKHTWSKAVEHADRRYPITVSEEATTK